MTTHSVILAAGKGSRMHSDLPKVLQVLAHKPLLGYVLDCARQSSDQIHVVCGHKKELVKAAFPDQDITWSEQTQQLGTAHAVAQAMTGINQGVVLILYGDVPLIQPETLVELRDIASSKQVALLSVVLEDPTGYGRIVRDEDNNISQIIEQKDADAQTLAICEVNTGIMAIQAELLQQYLPKINSNNAQGELYLTDIVGLLTQDNIAVSGLICNNEAEVMGVNDKVQLAFLERVLQHMNATHFMQQGLTIKDPNRFDCRGSFEFGTDCSVDINTIIEGDVVLGNRVVIEANCQLKNCTIGDDSVVYGNSIIEDSIVEQNVKIGPFARLRPQTHLKDNSKIGNFVEVKKSTIGKNSKVNHLSYIGDAIIGESVNIGAGVITCNYDGVNKHQTQIQDGAFIGSNSALVAPIIIGKDATIGAGSTITKNTPDEQLSLTRAKQINIKNWQRPKKKPLN